ncbi:hypothetical protein AMAG_00227 [Allomyces macrogynus ATCC 38327]|uniref:Thioredoxin domain-containing protein n=1 Tax=Allomyces macrogynus (strain ATCC 38327) TaxID=578462 RepID=A0A0L0RUY5_ALLM3|nr:hypothetical protein AMAG_00227 [Allomyces macrogynus ATCC 38327]|eukprot:KNE54237.1 hypothetical protein AMAG_00227 [Allomyces macrogynus ATCC 38327]
MYFDNDYVRVLTVHAHAQLLRLITEHQSTKHIVVHLSCTTCGACRALEADIAALSLKYPVNAVFLRANVAILGETAAWAGLPKDGDLSDVRAPMVRVFPSHGDAAAIEFEGTHGDTDGADLAADDIEQVLLDLGAISYLDTHLHAFPPSRATATTAANVEGTDIDAETDFHHHHSLADTAPAAVSELALATPPAPASPEPSTMDLHATASDASPPPYIDQQPIDIDALMSIGATGTVPPATPSPVVCARPVSTDVADLLEYVDKLERIRKATLEDESENEGKAGVSPARRAPLAAAATGAKGAVAAAAVAVTAALVWTQMRAASVVAIP